MTKKKEKENKGFYIQFFRGKDLFIKEKKRVFFFLQRSLIMECITYAP